MSRKIELAQMMFHSLMHEMSGDQKLVFLTDIFCPWEAGCHEVDGTINRQGI